MVKSKKLLSLFLAVVMIVSTFTVMASAYTMGAEVAGDVNIKYTVEKVDTVPETAAGSAEYTADNIYAVSVWMQSDYAVEVLTAPIHFNKAHFSPIMLYDGEVTYPYGAGFGVDDYYENMGEGAVYAYSEGDYLNNTGMYKADGSKATTKALAKCIGLGNSNSEGVTIIAELVSPDHKLYSKWGAGLPEDTGVMYVNLDVASKTKTAYLNTIEGITTSTEWNKMFTFYFETITDEDVTGDEFGVYTADCYTVDASCDKNAGYYVSGSRVGYNPNKNVVSNAVVEKAAAPELSISWFKNQIRFDLDKEGAYANQFDYRIVGQFDNFDDIFADLDDANAKITDVGYVFTNSEVMDVEAAKAQVEGGEVVYSQVTDCYVSTSFDGTDYAFACFVSNIADNDDNKAATLYGLGYVIYENADGVTSYAYYDATLDVGALYNQYK